MSDYNLDEQVEESFKFKLGGNDYSFRYPNTEEITAAQKLTGEDQLSWLYEFITPVEATAPSIKDTLDKVNVKTLQKFNAMVKAEFSADE